jgi:hypothetical protein
VKIRETIREHPIQAVAVAIVTAILIFSAIMTIWLTDVLTGPGWCGKALGAEKQAVTNGTIDVATACIGMLTIQLKAVATNSHIFVGMFALAFLTIIAVVIAGARLAGKTPLGEFEIGKLVEAAAQKVMEKQEEKES